MAALEFLLDGWLPVSCFWVPYENTFTVQNMTYIVYLHTVICCFEGGLKLGLVARKTLSSGFLTKRHSNQSAQLQRLARKFKFSPEESLDMLLLNKRITKALSRLRKCAGWSAPLLFANLRRQFFSRRGPNINASSFKTFFTYILRQNGITFWKELFVGFKNDTKQKRNIHYISRVA